MYEHPAAGRGRPQAPPNGTTNENYPNSMYGHSMSQPSQGTPYYPADMAERRPLQPMQPDGQSLMGKVAMRQQQLLHAYHGRAQSMAQPPMCLPPLPSVGFTAGRPRGGHNRPAYGQVGEADIDFPLSGQLQPAQPTSASYPEDMGYHLGAYSQPQHMMPQAQDPWNRGAAGPAGMERYGSDMSCDPPPAMYSGFTPSRTSSPIRLAVDGDQQGYGRERSYGRQAAYGQQPQAEAGSQLWTRPVYGRAYPDRAPQPQPQGPEGSASSQRSVRTSVSVSTTPSQPKPSASAAPSGGPLTRTDTTPMKAPPPPTAATGSRPATPSSSFSATPTKSSSERPARRTAPTAAAEPGLRLLTGTVDNILTWGRKLEEEVRPNVLFEIVGSLDSTVRGHWYSSRVVSLRSLQSSATLSVVFWEIDLPLSPPPTGSIVSCLCRLGPKWPQSQQSQLQRRMPRMQLLKMKAVSAGQVAHLKRIAYVSGHVVQQGALAATPAAAASPSATPPPSPLKQTLISSYTAPRASRT